MSNTGFTEVGTSPAEQFPRASTNPHKKMKSSNQHKTEGTGKKLTGKIKEGTGKAVGNERLQAKGKAEQVAGKIQKKLGDTKKAVNR